MKRFLLSYFILTSFFVHASDLALDVFHPEAYSEPVNDALLQALQAALGDTGAQALFEKQPPVLGGQAGLAEETQTKNKIKNPMLDRFADLNFYQDYLAKYYPKALVITNHFFAAMTPEKIESALKDIVELLADRPFFYFMNDQKKFKATAYWECILDQLSLINEFLCIAYINADNSISFITESDTFSCPRAFNTYQPVKHAWLIDWLGTQGKKVLPDFHALCFDYAIKLFNEGILLFDFAQTTRYLGQVEWLAEKLRDSADYTESMKTAKELHDLLKQRLGLAYETDEDQHDWD